MAELIQLGPGRGTVTMTRVDAKTFESVGYSVAGRQLLVKFRNSPVTCFEGVPGFRFSGLLASPRKDAYFKTYIKDQFLSKPLPTMGGG